MKMLLNILRLDSSFGGYTCCLCITLLHFQDIINYQELYKEAMEEENHNKLFGESFHHLFPRAISTNHFLYPFYRTFGLQCDTP